MDSLVVGAIGAAFGTVITAIGAVFVNFRGQKQKENGEMVRQSVEVYRGICESLKKDSIAQVADISRLNEERTACREKCAAQTIQIKYLETENDYLRRENNELKAHRP